MGVKAVLVKSYARIHETNLKKQGVLALTFLYKDDYDKIQEDDTFKILGLANFLPGKNLELEIVHRDSSIDLIEVCHTYNANQIDWFYAGSSLNVIANQA